MHSKAKSTLQQTNERQQLLTYLKLLVHNLHTGFLIAVHSTHAMRLDAQD